MKRKTNGTPNPTNQPADAEALVRLTLRPLASSVPVPIRLRHLLKHALRMLQLRCVKVEEIPAPGATAAGPGPNNATGDVG